MGIKYASIIKRAVAYLIDILVFLFTSLIIVLLLNTSDNLLVQIICAVWIMIFEIGQLTIFKGRTIGKIIFKLRILDSKTLNPPTNIFTYIKRFFACKIVMSLFSTIYSLLGLCYALWGIGLSTKNELSQSAWDKVAGTIVIDESK